MKKFAFAKIYFKKNILDDHNLHIRVVMEETPSMDIKSEDYSLRIETRHDLVQPVHRKYAIEHHIQQEKHQYPHLQFTFHTEEIGTFRIKLDFENDGEYKSAILGFIYKTKKIFEKLDEVRKGTTQELLNIELVEGLDKHEVFLNKKIFASIMKYPLDFKRDEKKGKILKIESNPLLIDFLGEENINNMKKRGKLER